MSWAPLANGAAIQGSEIPVVGIEALTGAAEALHRAGGRVVALFGDPVGVRLRLTMVASTEGDAPQLQVVASEVGTSFPSLTHVCPQVHLFEREIHEQYDVEPAGHPNLQPVRFHWESSSSGDGLHTLGGPTTSFFRVEGSDVHEVAVGPVHAGVIEPGHFRFQCHGEHVYHLEIKLGFQHRGIENRLVGAPLNRALHQVEVMAGDTTVAHTIAYCRGVEALAGAEAPPRAQEIRALALELERLANHTGDLGAMAGDVGYLPTASYCGRLRGDFLNATALVCGNRFGRSLVRVGGSRFDLGVDDAKSLEVILAAAGHDTLEATQLLWDSYSVLARFEGTGTVSREDAHGLGLVGVAARACGLVRDVRSQFPTGWYRRRELSPITQASGDVFARARVRWGEVGTSLDLCQRVLSDLSGGPTRRGVGPLRPDSFVVSLVESWRGEVCHVVRTDGSGQLATYKVVDPSFHNWSGLEMALRDQPISDFPLCNKSFNLSYCGHDL